MNNEKAIENKKEDNRAFGKFALIIAASMLVGAVMGAASVFFKNGQKTLAEMLVNGLGIVAPFLPVLLTTIVILMNAVTEKQCRKLYRGWDGEDEDIVNRIEMKLSNVLIATSVLLILTFFSFSAGIYGLDERNPYNIFTQVKIFALFGGMIYAMVALTLIQKQIVNFEKEINPEKKGSVYDPKFQKKWLESCDEGEKLQIYKSAYKAYQMTQGTCMLLWIITTVGSISFDFGLLPMTCVIIIWLVMTLTYSLETMRLSKHPSEIMK